MTTKRYRNATRVSRSRGGAPRRRPFGQHYEAIRPASEPHPIDLIIDATSDIARHRREIRRASEAALSNSRNPRVFIAYDDLRGQLASTRENLYFDAGFEMGLDQGRAESAEADVVRNRALQGAARGVRVDLLRANLSRPRAAALLLEVARGLVLGLPQSRRGAPTGGRPTNRARK